MNTKGEEQPEDRRRLHWSLAIVTLSTVPLYVVGLALLLLSPAAPAAAADQPTHGQAPAGIGLNPPLEESAPPPVPTLQASRPTLVIVGEALPSNPVPAVSDEPAPTAPAELSMSWVPQMLTVDQAHSDAGHKNLKAQGKGRGAGRGKR